MALDEDIEKIKELNEEIEILSKKLKEPTKIFEEGEINQAKLYIKSLRSELLKVDSDLNYIAQSFRRSVQELSKQNTFLNQGKKSLRGISDISSQLLRIKYGEVDASSQDISKLIQKAAIKEDELKQAILLLKTAEKQTAEIKAQTKELEDSLDQMEAFKKGADDVLDIQKKIQKNGGVRLFSGLEAITNAIPGLNKFTGAFTEASKAAKATARANILDAESIPLENAAAEKLYKSKVAERKIDEDILQSGKGLTKEVIKRLGLEKKLVGTNKAGKPVDLTGTAAAKKAQSLGGKNLLKPLKVPIPKKLPGKMSKIFGPLFAGIKAIGPMLTKALGPIGLLISLVKVLFEADKATAELAKNMNITYGQASKVRQEFALIAAASGDNFVTTKGIQESQTFITKQLGIQKTILEGDLLTSAARLRDRMGLTNEEIQGMVNLQLTSKSTLDEITKEILGQAKITSVNNKVQLNNREILKEIKDVSAATTLSLGKNPAAISDAITQAKALGMTLGQVEKISESLLNFESSIASELKAELLLGKDINLEQARLFALNNNIAGVAKEISSQIGNSAEFAKMNVIQQKALAGAVGMSRDELAKTLFVQENIKATTEAAAVQEKFLLGQLVEKFGIEEARRRLGEKDLDTMKNQVSVQDKFNKMMLKLKEIFVAIAPQILSIANDLANMLEVVGKVFQFFSPEKFSDFNFEETNSDFVTSNDAYQMNDGTIDFQKGVGVTGEFGTVQLDPKDTGFFNKGKITAGTDLFKNFLPNDMIAENPGIKEENISQSLQPIQSVGPIIETINPLEDVMNDFFKFSGNNLVDTMANITTAPIRAIMDLVGDVFGGEDLGDMIKNPLEGIINTVSGIVGSNNIEDSLITATSSIKGIINKEPNIVPQTEIIKENTIQPVINETTNNIESNIKPTSPQSNTQDKGLLNKIAEMASSISRLNQSQEKNNILAEKNILVNKANKPLEDTFAPLYS